MPFQKKGLARTQLYLVLDRQVADYDALFEIMQQAVSAGVDIVQLRDKHGSAKEISCFVGRALRWLNGRVPFIVNDRVDIAKFVGADGVHLGQDDLPVILARKILGRQAIIGVSCQTRGHVRQAQEDGADYIGFGSVFKTLTKPDRKPMDLPLLSRVIKAAQIPIFAIGGIGPAQVNRLRALGIRRVAVTRAICEAKDVAAATRKLKNILLKGRVI
jgi:thiamine-phosphate pyrophosphorylase